MADPVLPPSAFNGQGLSMPIKTRPIDDINNNYELAVRSGDAGLMKSVANDSVGTEVNKKASDALGIMEKNTNEYKTKVLPVVEKLQTGNPEDRLKAVKDFETINDHPKYGSWLIATLTGNPKASQLITGGVVKPFFEMGNDGRMYQVHRNELGEPVDAVDYETKQPIDQAKFARLKVGMPLTEDYLKKTQENNIEAKNAEDKQINAYKGLGTQSELLGQITKDVANRVGSTYGFTQKEMSNLIGTVGANYGSSQSISDVTDKLDSLSKGKGAKFNETDEKELRAAGGILGLGSVSGSGGHVLVNGRDANSNELAQLQKHFSSIKEKSSNFNVDQESSAAHAAFMRLKPEDQTLIRDLKRRQAEYYALERDVKTTHGPLTFLTPTASFDYLTTPNAMEAQAETLIHNGKTIADYDKWRQQKLEQMGGSVPVAGALQSSYIGSDTYQNNAHQLKDRIVGALTRPAPQIAETPTSGETLTTAMGQTQNAPVASPATRPALGVAPRPTVKEVKKERKAASEIIKNTLKMVGQ